MTKNQIIEQLTKMPENARVIWMLEKIEEIRNDFETASDRIEDRCEKLITDFFSETLSLPAEIKKYAQIGIKYQNFIDRFKSRIALDDCVVSGEAKELLHTAKAEILKLRSNIRKAKESTSQVKRDMRVMERQLFAWREIDTLKTDLQKRKAKQLTESGNLPKYKISEIIESVRNE